MVVVDCLLLLPLAGTLGLVWLVSHVYDPQRLSGRLVRAWTLGALSLLLWNALPLPRLGLNSLSAVTAGALGLPGLGLLAVLTRLL